ncbi:MAG: hypothetical protein HY889_01050 [Deltaproteobacteria bacterium]|nr:hypothetical protein [Deltaproteobacteria bacterium]
MHNRPFHFRCFTTAAFAALCILFGFNGARAAESGAVAQTIQKIDQYSKGLKTGMTLKDAERVLGKPNEKKEVPGPKDAGLPKYYAMWQEKGYSIDAQFGKDDRIVSYGIHWFGKPGTAPEFKDILTGDFKETERLGTRISTLEDKEVTISWRKTPVPDSDKFIDMLTVAKKR